MSKGNPTILLDAAKMHFDRIGDGSEKMMEGLKAEMARADKTRPIAVPDTDIRTIMQTAQAVKRAGVYPFFVTRLAATAMYNDAQDGTEVGGMITMGGVRTAAEALFGASREPELALMISQGYAAILAGTFFDIDEKKLALMKKGYENGFANEATYHGCAQCTIKAFFDAMDIAGEKPDYLFRAASSLAGGIGICTDSACGAYSGSNLIIGTYNGRTHESLGKEGSSARPSHRIAQVVHDKFIAAYGSTICRDLHCCKMGRAYNLRDEKEAGDFHNAGAHDEYCPTTVGIATAWLIEALMDEGLI